MIDLASDMSSLHFITRQYERSEFSYHFWQTSVKPLVMLRRSFSRNSHDRKRVFGRLKSPDHLGFSHAWRIYKQYLNFLAKFLSSIAAVDNFN